MAQFVTNFMFKQQLIIVKFEQPISGIWQYLIIFNIKGEHFETTHFRNATCSKLMFFYLFVQISQKLTKVAKG